MDKKQYNQLKTIIREVMSEYTIGGKERKHEYRASDDKVYTLVVDTDIERDIEGNEEVRKDFHRVILPDGKSMDLAFSPYVSNDGYELFKLWVEIYISSGGKLPTGQGVVSKYSPGSNWNEDDLKKWANQHDIDISGDVSENKGNSDDKEADIADYKELINNPPVEFAIKNYGSVDKYKKMLQLKIDRLTGKFTGSDVRIRSDEPEPFGYGEEETMNEVAPPGFPEALEKKLLKQYKATPAKAYATMWKLHKMYGDKLEEKVYHWEESKKHADIIHPGDIGHGMLIDKSKE